MSQLGSSVFEQVFGKSSAAFKTVSEVNDFVATRNRAFSPNANSFAGNNFVLPQGNVFSISSGDVNNLIDNALEEQQKCLKRFR